MIHDSAQQRRKSFVHINSTFRNFLWNRMIPIKLIFILPNFQ